MSLLARLRGKISPRLTREESLRAIPVRNEKVEVEQDEDLQETLIRIPRRDDWWVRWLARIFFIPKHRKVTLDELGSFVWNFCDGKHTVGELIDAFAARYKLNRKEAELSMTAFLRMLAKRRLIGLAVPQSAIAGNGKTERHPLRSPKRKRHKKVGR